MLYEYINYKYYVSINTDINTYYKSKLGNFVQSFCWFHNVLRLGTFINNS